VVEEFSFLRPQEIAWMGFVEIFHAFLRVSAGRNEFWRIWEEGWHSGEGIASDVSFDSEAFWYFSYDGMGFPGDWFVFPFGFCEDGNGI
jgi:hypothetical protein